MIHYTLCFVFNKDLSKVLLIHKLTPEWQKGMVNGLGGKYEIGEDCFHCIIRELKEESGLVTLQSDWQRVGELCSTKWKVDVLTMAYMGNETDAQSLERQKVEWFMVSRLPENIMSNLSWLIPMCVDKLKNVDFDLFSMNYKI